MSDTEILEVLVAALHQQDSSRPRSRQRRLGPSAVGGCRRQAWRRLQGIAPTNHGTARLPAIIGTAIHSAIESAFDRVDPFGDRYELEIEVEHDGVLGHVDCYDRLTGTVWDWKSTTLKSLKYWPKVQQTQQVQAYGALLEASGRPVKRVGLVAIPRDGNEGDLRLWSDDYRPEVAAAAFRWLREVEEAIVEPEAEMPLAFCAPYCEFFGDPGEGGCPGRGK